MPKIKKRFSEEFDMPKFALKKEILAPPLTKNYGLIGTSFDYLMRFHLERINKNVVTKRWVAELVPDLINDSSLLKKINTLISKAKNNYSDYLKTGKLDNKLIESAIHLGQIDPIFRANYIDPNLGKVNKKDIVDMQNLIKLIDPKIFKAKKLCILNPTFGEASELVGGADADLIIDDMLIDIKTIKKLQLKKDHFNQVIGYYILHEIGSIEGVRKKLEIKRVAIYFSRYGELYTIPVGFFTSMTNFSNFIKWFKKEADNTFKLF